MRKINFFLLVFLSLQMFAQSFIQRNGKTLMYQEKPILLRGMAFGNLVWDDTYADTPNKHHSEADYQRLEDLGMNAIRFYLNYKTFENDATTYSYKQSAWDWLDQNIVWAKAHNVYLILNMHVPQGGFQSRCEGDALWTNIENQNRLKALWKEIATRYKNEPQIAGYDILNEPTPSTSINKWSTLAQGIIDNIRTVDNNHLIITERALALGCDYSYTDANNNYPQITESNLMYTVHMYDPFEFTHQSLEWAGTGDGGAYPDQNIFTIPEDATYATGNYANPNIKTGTNDWTQFTGVPFSINTDSILFGRVVFQSRNLKTGKVYFDDFVLQELDANNTVVKTIYSTNPTSGNYWSWAENGTGSHKEETIGHNDSYSVSITGNTAGYTIICQEYTFKVRKGYKYRISGWMKGENVPSGSTASFGTDFSHSPSKQSLGERDYNYLVKKITDYSKYIEDLGYPVYFGEFGAARTCFVNDKGGDRWVKDCLTIFDSLGYHFTYHSYKESSFGYYDGWDKPVQESTVNVALKKVFQDFYNKPLGIFVYPNHKTESEISLSPNPCTNFIEIKNSLKDQIDKITILSTLGEELIQIKSNKIDVSQLTKGQYLIKIYYNNTFTTQSFVKL
jgi:endoglucanase